MSGDPLWINKDAVTGLPSYDSNELRQDMALPLMYGGRNLGARQGVRPGGNQLTVSLAGSVITVQPGVCCIDPGLTTPQGPYWVAIPAPENPVGGPLAAADGSNPRKDIVIGRVYDHDADASGLRFARSEYIAGVAGAAPSEPNVPAGAMRLATIDVPKVGSGSPVVTNNAPYTVASGGLLPVRNQAEEDLITPIAYDGMPIWRIDQGLIKVRQGNGWAVFTRDLASGDYWATAVAQNFTTTAYANVTSASVPITKVLASTKLRVRFTLAGFGATSTPVPNIGVLIAGTDYKVGGYPYPNTGAHYSIVGERVISGIPAGAQTVQLRAKVDIGGGPVWGMDGGDTISIAVQEVV